MSVLTSSGQVSFTLTILPSAQKRYTKVHHLHKKKRACWSAAFLPCLFPCFSHLFLPAAPSRLLAPRSMALQVVDLPRRATARLRTFFLLNWLLFLILLFGSVPCLELWTLHISPGSHTLHPQNVVGTCPYMSLSEFFCLLDNTNYLHTPSWFSGGKQFGLTAKRAPRRVVLPKRVFS